MQQQPLPRFSSAHTPSHIERPFKLSSRPASTAVRVLVAIPDAAEPRRLSRSEGTLQADTGVCYEQARGLGADSFIALPMTAAAAWPTVILHSALITGRHITIRGI
jgi:hypothetical protein